MKRPIVSPIQLQTLKQEAQKNALFARMIADLIKIHGVFLGKLEEVNHTIEKKIGPPGKNAKKVTPEEIIALFHEHIVPLIPEMPEVIHGTSPSEEDLVALFNKHIVPLIPPPAILPIVEHGVTPIRGVDYFTPADKEELILHVLSKIPPVEIPSSPEVDDETVINALEKPKKGKKLQTKHVDGLDQTLSAFRNQLSKGYLHGGGISKLNAGANITLVINADGSYTIASPGGGSSLTPVSATEIPNGNRTLFTFPTGTIATPAFVVSDGANMRATTASGFVNWTWNSGTKQVTMTFAPNEDIVILQ